MLPGRSALVTKRNVNKPEKRSEGKRDDWIMMY